MRFPSIFTWLSEHQAGISAVVGIAVLAGIVFARVRSLLRRRAEPSPEANPQKASEDDPLLTLPIASAPQWRSTRSRT